MSDKTAENRQLLLEKYSFNASDGKKYTVRPASMEDLLDGSFMEKINIIGIPDIERSPRIHFAIVMGDEKKRQAFMELAEKYIYYNDEPIRLTEATLTADDLILIILRLAGISG